MGIGNYCNPFHYRQFLILAVYIILSSCSTGNKKTLFPCYRALVPDTAYSMIDIPFEAKVILRVREYAYDYMDIYSKDGEKITLTRDGYEYKSSDYVKPGIYKPDLYLYNAALKLVPKDPDALSKSDADKTRARLLENRMTDSVSICNADKNDWYRVKLDDTAHCRSVIKISTPYAKEMESRLVIGAVEQDILLNLPNTVKGVPDFYINIKAKKPEGVYEYVIVNETVCRPSRDEYPVISSYVDGNGDTVLVMGAGTGEGVKEGMKFMARDPQNNEFFFCKAESVILSRSMCRFVNKKFEKMPERIMYADLW